MTGRARQKNKMAAKWRPKQGIFPQFSWLFYLFIVLFLSFIQSIITWLSSQGSFSSIYCSFQDIWLIFSLFYTDFHCFPIDSFIKSGKNPWFMAAILIFCLALPVMKQPNEIPLLRWWQTVCQEKFEKSKYPENFQKGSTARVQQGAWWKIKIFQ